VIDQAWREFSSVQNEEFLCAVCYLRHRPFGSQGKQECLCYWKAKDLVCVAITD
jgi:hypothetical protein